MTQGHLDRSKAVRLAGASKIAFGAIVACGVVGTMFLGRGEIATPQGPLTLVELPPLANAQTAAGATTPVDNTGIVERFDLIANAPAKPAAASTSEDASTSTPPPQPADAIEYLGQIGFGTGRLALIRHNAVQRIVATGDAVGSFTIIEITPSKLVVQEGERRSDIELKSKSGDVLSRAGGAAGATAANGFPANAGGANDPASIARRQAAAKAQQQAQIAANASRTGPSMTAQQQGFLAGMKDKAAGGKNPVAPGAGPKPNSPEGFQARFDAVMDRLKATGQFQSEEDMILAAKKLMKAEDEDQ